MVLGFYLEKSFSEPWVESGPGSQIFHMWSVPDALFLGCKPQLEPQLDSSSLVKA